MMRLPISPDDQKCCISEFNFQNVSYSNKSVYYAYAGTIKPNNVVAIIANRLSCDGSWSKLSSEEHLLIALIEYMRCFSCMGELNCNREGLSRNSIRLLIASYSLNRPRN